MAATFDQSPSPGPSQNLALGVLRYGAHSVWDSVAKPIARRASDVPPSIDAITPEWLTAVLCRDHEGVEVSGFDLGEPTSGSSVRRNMRLSYTRRPGNADLPDNVFAKSSPRFFNRLMLSISRTVENEAKFYRHIRPLVSIEAPRGYYSAYDLRSGRSIHLLEDLVATKGATFCTARDKISRRQAEEIVDLLADFHGAFLGQPDLRVRFPWLPTHSEWIDNGFEKFGLRTYHEKALVESSSFLPRDIDARKREIWGIHRDRLRIHATGPQTLLHTDVHLGNWYITQEGRMGLCDWQCVSIGHWARDVAYAIAATLTIEDRRAWERDLIARYVTKVDPHKRFGISAERALELYRSQLPAALLMWTVTLCHSPLMPDMQPRGTSLEMVKRIATAMSDLNALDQIQLD